MRDKYLVVLSAVEMKSLDYVWIGRISLSDVRWNFSPGREVSLSDPLEAMRDKIWDETLQKHPDSYDGKVLTLHDMRFESDSLTLDVGFIRFSRLITLARINMGMDVYGSVGFQSIILNSERTHFLLGRRNEDNMYCPDYYAIPGGMLEVSDTSGSFMKACLREIEEEALIPLADEIVLLSIFNELHGTVGIIFLIECTATEIDDVTQEVQGNDEWNGRKLWWQDINDLEHIKSENDVIWLSLVSSNDRKLTELIKYISDNHFHELNQIDIKLIEKDPESSYFKGLLKVDLK